MKKSLFFLAIFIIFLFSTCKKDENTNIVDDGPVRFRFTAGPFFESNPNQSDLVPLAYLFLYDSNGVIIKEQSVYENRVQELTTSREGEFSVGVFYRKWYDKDFANNLIIFQNIPSGFEMKTLERNNGDLYNSIFTNTLNQPILIKNIKNIDSVKHNNIRLRKIPFEYFINNDSCSIKGPWLVQFPYMLFTEQNKLPKFVFFSPDEFPTNSVIPFVFDFKNAISGSKKQLELDKEDRWLLDIYAKKGDNYLISDRLNDLIRNYDTTKLRRIEYYFPDKSFDQYLFKVKGNVNSFYYSKNTNADNQKINVPSFDFDLKMASNGSYTCSTKNLAKVMETGAIFGIFTEKDDSDDIRCAIFTNLTDQKSVPSLIPTFPKTLTKVYGIKNSKISSGHWIFDTNIIASKNDKVNMSSYLNYLYGDFSFEWPYQMEISSFHKEY